MKKHDPKIKNIKRIDKRPHYIESRRQFGHWEADTAVSRESKYALQICIERKTKKVIISLMKNKTSAEMHDHMVDRLSRYSGGTVRSITYDNGTENALHQEVNKALKCKSFFCFPYHSWEKGSVENVIGMIRWFFPKKTDFSKMNKDDIKWVEDFINNRPRKCLGFKSANEFFEKEISRCA